MSHWNNSELDAINDADDLKIAPFHEDQKTTGTPTWIWEVVVDNNLYVRAYSGVSSRWYQSAIKQKRGKIIAAGKTINVTFDMVDDPHLLEEIDKAYQTKYSGSPYVSAMVSSRAKTATVRIDKIR